MAEFGASATLEVTVPDRELRSARRQIERELGDVTVDVDASARRPRTDGSGGGGGGGGLGAAGVGGGVVLKQQLEVLEDIHEEVEQIAEEVARGGGGGGGGGLGLGLGAVAAGGTGGGIVSMVAGALGSLGGRPGVPAPGQFGKGGASTKPLSERETGPLVGLLTGGSTGGDAIGNVRERVLGQEDAPLQGSSVEDFPEEVQVAREKLELAQTQVEVLFPEAKRQLQVPESFPPELRVPSEARSLAEGSIDVKTPEGFDTLVRRGGIQVEVPPVLEAFAGGGGPDIDVAAPDWLSSLTDGGNVDVPIQVEIGAPELDISGRALRSAVDNAIDRQFKREIVQDVLDELDTKLGGF